MSYYSVVSGHSEINDWKTYLHDEGVYVDVDTSAAGFVHTPVYLTSISGDAHHGETSGATSVYQPTRTGFRIYIRWTGPDRSLNAAMAREYKWRVDWVAMGVAKEKEPPE